LKGLRISVKWIKLSVSSVVSLIASCSLILSRDCRFSRFTNIATVVLDLTNTGFIFNDTESAYVRGELKALVKAKSRIILLHVK